jgi:hypothetical protein
MYMTENKRRDTPNDVFASYERGVERLLEQLGKNHPAYSKVLGYQQRLYENIDQSRRYGDTSERQAQRSEIISYLDEIARFELNISFYKLSVAPFVGSQSSDEKLTEDLLQLARDGAQPPADHTVRSLLEGLHRAWMDDDWDGMRNYYDDLLESRSQRGISLAQLYLASAQAQRDALDGLKKSVELTKRSVEIAEKRGARHLEMVAYLQLAAFEQMEGNLRDARRAYCKSQVVCDKLRSNPNTPLPYDRIYEEIEQSLGAVGRLISNQIARRCFLKSVPILQLSDGPNMILNSNTIINYVEIGVFRIGTDRYYLHPLDKTTPRSLEMRINPSCFALPVTQDGWPNSDSKQGDYALLRRQEDVRAEGPGASWNGEKWEPGHFKRDPDSGGIHFEPAQPRILGKSYAIGLFKPRPTI